MFVKPNYISSYHKKLKSTSILSCLTKKPSQKKMVLNQLIQIIYTMKAVYYAALNY